MASPSAWTAKAHGVTMSLSSGFGGRSNTRRYISEPTTRCPSPGLPSADPPASQTADARSGLLHPAAACRGGLTPAGAPLIKPRKLFKQPEPALFFGQVQAVQH